MSNVEYLRHKSYQVRRIRNGGKPLSIPVGMAQSVISDLRKAGLGLARISELSGVDRRGLQRILRGDNKRGVYASTYQRLLAVVPEPAPGSRVSAVGTHRRLQALQWAGWSMRALDRERGVSQTALILGSGTVTVAIRDEIEELTDRLLGRRPPGTPNSIARVKANARRKGFVPFFAWNNIDNPAEKPKGVLAA